uniref:Uncharacterized protein n=1 Tax=Escherichia coli TaxID=562 RepID=A0A1W5T871_ECOLX|nr:hypothetical protein [Escherichia coli]
MESMSILVNSCFCQKYGGWLDSATQAIDGLKETFAGGDPWKWVDELWEKVQQVAAYLMSKDTSKYVKTDGQSHLYNICWRDNCIIANFNSLSRRRSYY